MLKEKYYVWDRNTIPIGFREQEGYHWFYEGHSYYVGKGRSRSGWIVVESRSGLQVAVGETMKSAKNATIKTLEKMKAQGTDIEDVIQRNINKYRLSPLHRNKPKAGVME